MNVLALQNQYLGRDIFKDDLLSNHVDHIILTGWYMLRGSNQSFNTLFQLKDQYFQIDLKYKVDSKVKFEMSLNGGTQQQEIQLSKYTWIYIECDIYWQQDQNKIKSKINVFYGNQKISLEKNIINSDNSYFLNKNDIIITLGDNSNSCSMQKEIILYWKYDILELDMSPSTSLFNDLSSGDTYLHSYFDFFYTQSNQGFLINTGENQNKIILSHQRNSAEEVKQNESIKTDFININDNKGIMINFQVFIDPTETVSANILKINNLILLIQISHETTKLIINSNIEMVVNTKGWFHILIVIKNQLSPKCYFVVKDFTTNSYEEKSLQLNSQIQVAQLIFGGSDSRSILIDNIRIYKGTQIFKSGNCDYSTMLQFSQCILCSNNDSLNYYNSMQCQTTNPTEIQEIDYVIQYNRPSCPLGMVYVDSSNTCVCQKGFFLNDKSVCESCPRYCKECTINSCIRHQLRDQTGQCQTGTFDDGYSCITPNLEQITSPKYSYQSIYSYSLFFTLSYFRSTQYCYQQTVFTIDTEFYSGKWGIYFDTYLNSQNKCQIQITSYLSPTIFVSFDETQDLKMAIQVKSNLLIVALHTRGQTIITKINTIVYQGFKYWSSSSDTSQIKTMDLKTEINYENINQYFLTIDSKYIIKMQILEQQESALNYFINPINKAKMIFNNLKQSSSISGITFNQSYAQYQMDYIIQAPLSFTTMINVDYLEYTQLLMSYKINSIQFQLFLLPNNLHNTVSVRICYSGICRDTKYSFFYMNEPSFLGIFAKQLNPLDQNVYHQTFEVICNYKRERIEFTGLYTAIKGYPQDFQISEISTTKYQFNLQKFQIMEGNGYVYYNYDNSIPCFISLNMNDFECIYLKKQYVKCNGNIMLEQDCLKITQQSQFLYFKNRYSQTYEITDIKQSKCISLTINVLGKVQCAQCYGNYSEQFKCEQCKEGFYFNFINQQCDKCDIKCKSCQFQKDNCKTCNKDYSNKLLPTCNCTQYDYYLDSNLECQQCSDKCNTCIGTTNFCTQCSENRINPPNCFCDDSKFKEENGECIPIECSYKCEECRYNKDNCISCSLNRVNYPTCLCKDGFQEDIDGNCQPCGENQAYDDFQRQCVNCKRGCTQCNYYGCTLCDDTFILQNDSCVCSSDKQLIDTKNTYQCASKMFVDLNVVLQSKVYEFTLTFTQDLFYQNFAEFKFSDLIKIELPLVNQSHYKIVDQKIENNQITFSFILTQNIQVINGYLIFLENSFFISQSLFYKLDQNYIGQQIQFQIGPFLFSEEAITNKVDGMFKQIEMKQMSQSMTDFLRNFQFIFYILNTLQPTSMFFLIKAEFPPGLYNFYQTICMLIFPSVPDYQSKTYKTDFNLFGYFLSSQDVKRTKIEPYSKLGYSSSFLVNAPILVIKYSVFLFLLLVFKILSKFDIKIIGQENFQKINIFLIQKLNSENEIALLNLTLSILIQLNDIEQDLLLDRIGTYLAIFFVIYHLIIFSINIKYINHTSSLEQQAKSSIFTERVINKKSLWKRNYFLIQYIKKQLMVFIIFFLYNFPLYVCIICAIILIISALSTFILEPYINKSQRILKIFGEAVLSAIWILHFQIVKTERKLFNSSVMDDSSVKRYQLFGTITIMLLVSYNLLFLLSSIISYAIVLYQFIKNALLNYRLKKIQKNQSIEMILQPVTFQSQSYMNSNIKFTYSKTYKSNFRSKSIYTDSKQIYPRSNFACNQSVREDTL